MKTSIESLLCALWCAENALDLATNNAKRKYWQEQIRMIENDMERMDQEDGTEICGSPQENRYA